MVKNNYSYDIATLQKLLDVSPEPISLEEIMRIFGFGRESYTRLTNDLKTLEKNGKLKHETEKRFQSTKPLSDLVIARVSESVTGQSKVQLEIMNLAGKQFFPVTITSKKIRSLQNTKGVQIQKGTQMAVILERGQGAELKVRKTLGVLRSNKRLNLTVKFTQSSQSQNQRVRLSGHKSRITFQAKGKPPEKSEIESDFRAKISKNFDPHKPALHVYDRKWDPETGAPIHQIVMQNNNAPIEHSEEAIKEAISVAKQDPWADRKRRDLTHENILVIDPVNAHDHDDGILIEKSDAVIGNEKAHYRTLVTITDMAFFIKPGSTLEQAAIERGFSHYFGRDAVHLYPDIFADEIASLKTGKTRPVIYVEKFWNQGGEKIGEATIGTGIIESQRVVNYRNFQSLVDDNDPSMWDYEELGDKLISSYRHDSGLVFEELEQNSEDSYGKTIVASLMQDAGEEMAEMLNKYNIPFPRRAHWAKENIYAYTECREDLQALGYDIPKNPYDIHFQDFHDLLSEAEKDGQRHVVEQLVRRNLLHQAHYTTLDHGHFALNKPRYAQGTSPIRRYLDLLVQRAIHTAEGNHELGLSEDDIANMEENCKKMNYLQEVNKSISLDYGRYHSISVLAGQEGHVRNISLSSIREGFVHLDMAVGKNRALRQSIKVNDLPTGWSVNPAQNGLEYGDKDIPIGSQLKITIDQVKPEEGKWTFRNMIPHPSTKRTIKKNPSPKVV